MDAPGDTRPHGGPGEAVAGTRGGEGGAPSPGLLAAGVYGSRPLTSLPEAVADALDLPTRSDVPDGPDPTLDLDPLWARPELHARLVQATVSHAAGLRADVIVALGEAALPLASPAALRLGLPLRLRRDPRGRGAEGSRGRPYLVAGVLRTSDTAQHAGPTVADEARRAAGTCAVVRTGGGIDPMDRDNCLSILELDEFV